MPTVMIKVPVVLSYNTVLQTSSILRDIRAIYSTTVQCSVKHCPTNSRVTSDDSFCPTILNRFNIKLFLLLYGYLTIYCVVHVSNTYKFTYSNTASPDI